MTQADKQLILNEAARINEELVMALKRLEFKNKYPGLKNKNVFFLYSQLHGLINLCDKLKIKRDQFNWIYNL